MYDVIVIGAGPAGANAAIEASELGFSVLMIDEKSAAGGQVWRNKSSSIIEAPETETSIKGDALRDAVNSSNVDVKFDMRVWHIEKCDHIWNIHTENDVLTSKFLVIATGAHERVLPIPGWTLPGVMGLAGATALFKEHMMVPGNKTVVAGSGPLLFYVASEIERLGGHVEAVISVNSRIDWLKSLPTMIMQPKLLWQGFKWVLSFYRKTSWQAAPVEFDGDQSVRSVTIKNVDNEWSPIGTAKVIEADSVCYGYGLIPAIEASRLAGADHHYDETLGGWVPTIDEMGRTSVIGLHVCGDNAGILGALAAPIRGKNAAQALKSAGVFYDIGSVKPFGKAMTALSIPRKGMLDLVSQKTEVCRCEGVTREEIEHEITTGAQSPNAIKSGTRCGMGPCGGRFCAEAQAMINGNITGQSREEIGLPTARPPLRPMPMDEITESLNYDDLPIPGVSPL